MYTFTCCQSSYSKFIQVHIINHLRFTQVGRALLISKCIKVHIINYYHLHQNFFICYQKQKHDDDASLPPPTPTVSSSSISLFASFQMDVLESEVGGKVSSSSSLPSEEHEEYREVLHPQVEYQETYKPQVEQVQQVCKCFCLYRIYLSFMS